MKVLSDSKYIVSIANLTRYINKYSEGYSLSLKDKEFIVESFKSHYDDMGKLIHEEITPQKISGRNQFNDPK